MKLLADTSVMRIRPLRQLVAGLATMNGRLVVPALIYAERIFQIRRVRGADFRKSDIDLWFEQCQPVLEVESLDQERGDSLAHALYSRFSDEEAWRQVKRAAYIRAVGGDPPASMKGGHCGAPLDLYVAALGTVDAPLVTADKGMEWKGAPAGTVISLDEALKRLGASK